ncbi:MAG TPA: DUF2127 domain-containing protein [Candidatus Paceibacterota bacterium]|nr:DUF2127 domain-containing protein [Candidatus Paceibacterota bacterium]
MDTLRALQERYIYQLFRVGIFLKGMLSLVEIFVGIAAIFVSPASIGNAIITASQNRLADDPDSFIALHALPLARAFSLTPHAFFALYLLTRGVIKLVLVIALLKNKIWAYPAALAVLGLFLLFEIYEVIFKHSLLFIMFTIFDIMVVWLIWHEYGVVRTRNNTANTSNSNVVG